MLALSLCSSAFLLPSHPCSRRDALLGGLACGLGAAVPPARAEGGFESFAAGRQSDAAAEVRARLADPFSEARAGNPGRAGFADELPPLTKAERAQRADAAAKAAASSRPSPLVSRQPSAPSAGPVAAPTDELVVTFASDRPLGLTLRDLRVGFETGTKEGTSRVLVADVVPGGQAAESGKVSVDDVVVAVDGVNVERESARQVQARIASVRAEGRPATVTFRDALAFNARLAGGGGSRAGQTVSTSIAPGSGAGSTERQVLAVRTVEAPERCRRQAQNGDLLEIRFAVRRPRRPPPPSCRPIPRPTSAGCGAGDRATASSPQGRLEDGTVFDGMQLASRFADDSLQFVLGRQPSGQFPPSWDVGLVGMCVGERREIDVPPVLGFGPKGLPKRGVPPDARLLYDVELLAINADSSI